MTVRAFAVHIVTHNSAHTIAQCLAGLWAQSFDDYTLVVIDNASTDDTRDVLARCNVSAHHNADNLGYAAAHNQALALSESRYVLTLNPDVWLHPDFLRHVYAALESDATLGAVAGCLLRTESLGTAPHSVDSQGLIMTRRRQQRLRGEGDPLPTHAPAAHILGPDGAAAVYRRAMLADIAYNGEVFDTDFFIHKEDVDVCWRALWRGWRAAYVPDAVAHHVRTFRPGQRRGVAPHLKHYAVRNRYLLMLKNDTLGHFLRDAWPIMRYEILILGYIVLREPRSLLAYAGVLRLWPRMWAKRRHIHTTRTVTPDNARQWFV